MKSLCFDGVDRVLCMGAHADDVEIGCGGTLLQLIRNNPALEILWVVCSANDARAREARASAKSFLRSCRNHRIEIMKFRESYFPYRGEQLKEFFDSIQNFNPDLVFTHYREDRHQDHRVLSDLAWNTFRNHLILEYEIPKYDGDLGNPNVFVSLEKRTLRAKLQKLTRFFPSQSDKHWFSEETFSGLMRLRGMECASETGYAEAFYARKLTMSFR